MNRKAKQHKLLKCMRSTEETSEIESKQCFSNNNVLLVFNLALQ